MNKKGGERIMIWKKLFYRALSDEASKKLSPSSLGIRLAARLASSGDGRICALNFDSKGRLISERFIFPRWSNPDKLLNSIMQAILPEKPDSTALALPADCGCEDFEYLAAIAEKAKNLLERHDVWLREFFLTDGLTYESLLNKEDI